MLCHLKHVGDPLPRLWRPIRNALKELAKQDNHISEREFMELCSDHGLKRERAQLLLSDYLHCLGVILHYRNDPHLRDFIILNPQWAVDAVYSVLSDERVKNTAGRFHWKFLEEVWRDYSREERSRLLMLMTKNNFEICYEIADGQYIAPQLLDDVKPVYAWESVSSLKFRFRYQFMAKGILTRLIVRLNEHIASEGDADLVCGKDVVLRKDGGRAEVIEDEFQQRIIDIEVAGSDSQKKDVMRWVRDEVEAIHRKWFKNVDFERMVPCNCEVCNTASEPTFLHTRNSCNMIRNGKPISSAERARSRLLLFKACWRVFL